MIFKEDGFVRSKWLNGKGETLQLIIHPQGTDFKLQQFKYRLSAASLTAEPSKFSHFPNYIRSLLVLEGEPVTIINHTKSETYVLEKMQNVITFDGADELESFPQTLGLDFNLFVAKNSAGELRIIDIQAQKILKLQQGTHHFFNGSQETVKVTYGEQQFFINKGELFICKDIASITLICENSTKIILASVYGQ